MHANSTGVTKQADEICHHALHVIKRKQPDFIVNQYIINVHDDVIQQGGYSTILSDAAATQMVNTSLLEADSGRSSAFNDKLSFSAKDYANDATSAYKGGLPTHVFNIKNGKEHLIQFKIYNNQILGHAEVIESHLKNKVLSNFYGLATTSPFEVAKRTISAGASLVGVNNVPYALTASTKSPEVTPRDRGKKPQ